MQTNYTPLIYKNQDIASRNDRGHHPGNTARKMCDHSPSQALMMDIIHFSTDSVPGSRSAESLQIGCFIFPYSLLPKSIKRVLLWPARNNQSTGQVNLIIPENNIQLSPQQLLEHASYFQTPPLFYRDMQFDPFYVRPVTQRNSASAVLNSPWRITYYALIIAQLLIVSSSVPFTACEFHPARLWLSISPAFSSSFPLDALDLYVQLVLAKGKTK